MTTAIGILLLLVAWTVLPLPLAVLVGRQLKAADGPEAAAAAPRPDLTLA